MKKFLHAVTLLLLAALTLAVGLAAVGCDTEPAETATEYTVSYVGGDGAEGEAPASSKHKEGDKITLETNPFTKEGFDFTGWNDGEKTYGEGTEYTVPAHDVTFTAQWTAQGGADPVQQYTVSYVGGNGAEGEAPASSKHEAGDKITLETNPFTKEGSDFAGWNDGEETYEEGAEYTVPDHDVTFTAQWTVHEEPAPKYALTYAGGDGATGDAPAAEEYAEGEQVTLAENPFQKAKHAFDGWTDGETTYPEGGTLTMPAHAVTLTATWKQNLFTLSYANGGGTGELPPASDHAEGDLVPLPKPGLTNGDKVFAGWLDGETLYKAGANYSIPSHDVTLTAKWADPDALSGKAFFSLTAKTLYQFGGEETDGWFPVNEIHGEGYSFTTHTDTVRYSYDGTYTIQTKEGDGWTDALTLDSLDGVEKLTLGGSDCYLFGASHTLTVSGDPALTLSFKLDGSYDSALGLKLEFTELAVNGTETELAESFSVYSYQLKVLFDSDDVTYLATVDLSTLSYTSVVYRITLTAEADGVQYRATFSDPYSDYFRSLEAFAVQEGGNWTEIPTEDAHGSSTDTGNGYHYAFTVTYFPVETTKTTYKIFPYAATAEAEAYFTVQKSEEHVKVTKTLTTGIFEATFEYDDPSDVSLTNFKKDGALVWANRFYYDANTMEQVRANVFDITYYWQEMIWDDDDHTHTEDRVTVYRVTYVPGDEPTMTVKEVSTHEVTFGDDVSTRPGSIEGWLWDKDGVRRYTVTAVVDQDGLLVSVKELAVYRCKWSINEWVRIATFTPGDIQPDGDGFLTFTQKVTAQNHLGAQREVTWHIRLKVTSGSETDEFSYELQLQNEVSFEIDGNVISELTVLVNEQGEVTLPTAEEISSYLPEGMTFGGWQLSDQPYEGLTYTTGEYGATAEYPTAADVKFVAKLTGEEIPVVNDLAGKGYYDWTNRLLYVFNETESEGFYTVNLYKPSGYFYEEDTTSVRYSVTSDGYTVYQNNGESWDVLATFKTVENNLTFGEATLSLSGANISFQLTEGEKQVTFSFDLTASAAAPYGSLSLTVTLSNPVYNGVEATISSSYSPSVTSGGTLRLRYSVGDTVYEATITMATLTSNLSKFGIILYTDDLKYKGEFSSPVGDGYSYITFSVKDENGTYNRVGYAQTYKKSDYHWELQISQDGDVTQYYSVDYVPEKDGSPASMTVQILKSKMFSNEENYRATFVWDENGTVSITLLQFFTDDGGYSHYASIYDPTSFYPVGEAEKVSDYVFKVTNDGATYTVTVSMGADGVPESFTVVQA